MRYSIVFMDIISSIKSCRAGNLESFGCIYDIFFRKIYEFIYYKTLDNTLSEDLTSEVFFKAMKAIKNFTGETEQDLKSWLYRIAHNSVIDHYRTKKEHIDISDIQETFGYSEDLSQNIDQKNKLEEILEYLNTLSPEKKQIVIMRIWEDLSYVEISNIT